MPEPAPAKAGVEQVLAPTLNADDIVAMDNLPAPQDRRRTRRDRGHGRAVLSTAALFADLNPIEMAFAKLKTLLRQAPERTRDGLWQRIGVLLDCFTSTECDNYFQAAGYGQSY